MKSFVLLLPLGLAILSVSCKSNPKVASTNPYQNNPYYSSSEARRTTRAPRRTARILPTRKTPTRLRPRWFRAERALRPHYNQATAPSYSGPATGSSSSAPVSYSGSGSKTHTVTSGENLLPDQPEARHHDRRDQERERSQQRHDPGRTEAGHSLTGPSSVHRSTLFSRPSIVVRKARRREPAGFFVSGSFSIAGLADDSYNGAPMDFRPDYRPGDSTGCVTS